MLIPLKECALPGAVLIERARELSIPITTRALENRLVTGQRKMARRKSPKDAKCPHCGRQFTKGGLKQHLRHVKCSPTSTASPRQFERVRCKHCGKSFHSTNSLRVHVSTVHPTEYAKSPGLMTHHRAPYHKKRNSDRSGGGADHHRGSSERASSRALSDAPPPSRGEGRTESARQSSGREWHEGHHHHAAIDSRDWDADRGNRQPAWQSETKKRMAEAASGK